MPSKCPLTEIVADAVTELGKHRVDFNVILCPGDLHGIAIASGVAMAMDMPLLIACADGYEKFVQLSMLFGTLPEQPRFCYVDDFFLLGRSLRHASDAVDLLSAGDIVWAYETAFSRARKIETRNGYVLK